MARTRSRLAYANVMAVPATGTTRLKGWLAASVPLLAVSLVVLATAQPAQAGFPGRNGLIAYVSDGRPFPANDDIYVTDETGAGHLRLTTDPGVDRRPAVSRKAVTLT